MKSRILAICSMLVMSFCTSAGEPRIQANKAAFYVGESVMACGVVAQVSKGTKAHYLNLDNRYPNQTLAVLIWNNDLKGFEQRFGNITLFENQRVCARGKITEYKNSLQIQVSNPQFLRLMQ